MDQQDLVKNFISKCRSRLIMKRRLAGFCLFILMSLWGTELALFSSTINHSFISGLIFILSLVGIFGAAIHAYRRFGPNGDPIVLETSAFIDRSLNSGSLVESTWTACQKQVAPTSIIDRLRAETLKRIQGTTPSNLVPIRAPRGFQLGVALAALAALFLFTGPLKDLGAHQTNSNSISLLDSGQETLEIVTGSSKKSDSGVDSVMQFQNSKSNQVRSKKNGEEAGKTVKVIAGKKDKWSDSQLADKKNSMNPEKKAQSKGADSDKGSGAGSNSGSESKSSPTHEKSAKTGAQGRPKKSDLLATGFNGGGTGTIKKVTDLGTQRSTFVLNNEQLNRRLIGVKAELSWPMRQTLKKYFQTLNEEKQ